MNIKLAEISTGNLIIHISMCFLFMHTYTDLRPFRDIGIMIRAKSARREIENLCKDSLLE